MTARQELQLAIKNLNEIKHGYEVDDNFDGVRTIDIAIHAIELEMTNLPLEFSLFSVDGGKTLWLSKEDAEYNHKKNDETVIS